jgi:hypothetical protein
MVSKIMEEIITTGIICFAMTFINRISLGFALLKTNRLIIYKGYKSENLL